MTHYLCMTKYNSSNTTANSRLEYGSNSGSSFSVRRWKIFSNRLKNTFFVNPLCNRLDDDEFEAPTSISGSTVDPIPVLSNFSASRRPTYNYSNSLDFMSNKILIEPHTSDSNPASFIPTRDLLSLGNANLHEDSNQDCPSYLLDDADYDDDSTSVDAVSTSSGCSVSFDSYSSEHCSVQNAVSFII